MAFMKVRKSDGTLTDMIIFKGDPGDKGEAAKFAYGDTVPDTLEDGEVFFATNGADYIVEQGTSGIWTYRKWYSGIAECWGNTVARTVPMTTLWGTNDFYCNDSAFPQIDYPFAFTQLPTVTVSPIATDYGYWMYALSADEATTATKKYGAGRPTSAASVTIQAAYHVIGRWK